MNNGNPNLNVNPAAVASAEDVECPKCKNAYFNAIFKLKRVSAIISPTGKATIMPIQVLACTKCNEALDTVQ